MNSEYAILELDNEKDNRAFEYVINKKRTEAKLLKGAKRQKNLEVEIKSGCVNLRFNDGSYHEVILPLLKAWQDKIGTNDMIVDQHVRIISIEKGYDNSKKHIDTKVIVMYL